MNRQMVELSIDEVLEFYEPEKVAGYCKGCRNYQNMWCCPEHDFIAEEYFRKYSKIIIIGIDIEYDAEEEIYEFYLKERKWVDSYLMELEKEYDGSIALIPGSCILCQKCSKPHACIHPDEMRYSLESLGIEVGELTKSVLKKTIPWEDEKERKNMQLVAGLLIK